MRKVRAVSYTHLYSYHVRDFSDNYRGYSDLNDYLCGKKQEQKNSTSQVQEIKDVYKRQDQPKSPNDTYTLSAFSIMPKSMDTLGHAGKFSSMNAFSLSVA